LSLNGRLIRNYSIQYINNMRRSIPFIMSACFVFFFAFSFVNNVLAKNDQERTAESTQAESEGTYVTGLTPARAKSLIGVASGLLSLIIGWKTRARANENTTGQRSWPTAALVLGLVAMLLSIVHLTNNTGGFGTGGGKAGAIVALILGLAGAVISGLALRSRRQA
jgi:glucan phosphoethanolaminetransferase (alkaline phosphatase superfamily)